MQEFYASPHPFNPLRLYHHLLEVRAAPLPPYPPLTSIKVRILSILLAQSPMQEAGGINRCYPFKDHQQRQNKNRDLIRLLLSIPIDFGNRWQWADMLLRHKNKKCNTGRVRSKLPLLLLLLRDNLLINIISTAIRVLEWGMWLHRLQNSNWWLCDKKCSYSSFAVPFHWPDIVLLQRVSKITALWVPNYFLLLHFHFHFQEVCVVSGILFHSFIQCLLQARKNFASWYTQ